MVSLLLGGRGRLTSAAHRRKAIELISEAHSAGAGLVRACCEIGISLRTLKRWRKACLGDDDGHDAIYGAYRQMGVNAAMAGGSRLGPLASLAAGEVLGCGEQRFAELELAPGASGLSDGFSCAGSSG